MPYGNGHIHDTYRIVAADGRRFVAQRINTHVFRDPRAVMDNIRRVTEHLHAQLAHAAVSDTERRALKVLPTQSGDASWCDASGQFWRVYPFVERTTTCETVQSRDQAYQAAVAFAQFQGALSDLPGPRLHETIPGFHHTPQRLATLREAATSDPERRATACSEELAFVESHASLAPRLLDAQRSGVIPERIVHNDTKLNNVLMDEVTGEGLCIVDLDTVMPGLVHYDFGDLVRTAACTTAEDSTDLDQVAMGFEHFEALAAGYLDGSAGFLTPAERDRLVEAGPLITFETGLRFLTDHLLGDHYFKIHHPGHNLERARVQFRLLDSMERQRAEIERCLAAPSA